MAFLGCEALVTYQILGACGVWTEYSRSLGDVKQGMERGDAAGLDIDVYVMLRISLTSKVHGRSPMRTIPKL